MILPAFFIFVFCIILNFHFSPFSLLLRFSLVISSCRDVLSSCFLLHDSRFQPSAIESWFSDQLAKAAAYRPDSQVAIVSIIGRSGTNRNSKADSLKPCVESGSLSRHPIDIGKGRSAEIQAYYNTELNVIFFQLVSVHDSRYLAEMLNSLPDDGDSIFEILERREEAFAKNCLFLFLVSHIVLLWHPNCANDVSNLRFFRTLELLRQESLNSVLDAISGLPTRSVPRTWAKNGRPCSPRLLCVFHNPPVVEETEARGGSATRYNPYRRLETCLEDQLYNILRSSRIITNNSGASLFAVPFNQPFAYIVRPQDEESTQGFIQELLEGLGGTGGAAATARSQQPGQDSLHDFLMLHVDQAFGDGFNDNMSRSVGQAAFELPRLHQFVAVAPTVYSVVMSDPAPDPLKALSTEIHFSEGRCVKVYPYALSTYQEGLPPFYTAGEHAIRLAHVQGILRMQARGPAVPRYMQRLIKECEDFWRDGRQACEALSLRGNNCTNARHLLAPEPDSDLPVMLHASKATYICTCSCGHRQALREDPFDLQAANLEFFWATPDFTCCHDVERRHEFPVFRPAAGSRATAGAEETSSSDTEPDVSSVKLHDELGFEQSMSGTPRNPQARSDSGDPDGGFHQERKSHDSQLSPPDVLSDTDDDEDVDDTDRRSMSAGRDGGGWLQSERAASQNQQTDLEHLTAGSGSDHLLDQGSAGHAGFGSAREESADAQAPSEGDLQQIATSAVEYLPGMSQVHSPHGLLPLFSSWSLLCVGPSSLYTHAHGLREQPNFSHGSAYLLSWDVPVEVKDLAKWQSQVDVLTANSASQAVAPAKKTRPPAAGRRGGSTTFSVKIFVGYEYECPRGHRFMLMASNKMLKHSGPGGPKDPASAVVKSDMPLWFPCSCRTISAAFYGQLMRIHVVTPKMPVFVSVQPRVQPSAGAPNIFCPSGPPARIPPAEYWVLRLPYAYMADPQTVFHPPKPGQSATGKLLKHALTVEPFS